MPLPPPGHPHYMSDEDRQALATAATRKKYDPDEEDAIDMTTSAAALKYQELRKKIAEAKKVMEETAKGLFVEMTTELFTANPALESFGWRQYTPYWND